MTPRATYRLQFRDSFPFDEGARLVPYLSSLGISHVYASPILTARAGSSHGYDGVDPTHVNPELGGEDGLRRLTEAVRRHGMGLIVDIVPNHMAVGGADNRWWLDVLENGPSSQYASFFDIDWNPPDPVLKGKVHAPFLGAPYGQALANGEIKLVFDPDLKRLAAGYYHHRFPIRPQDYAPILREGGPALKALAEAFAAGAGDRTAFAAARADLAAAGDAVQPALDAFTDPDRLHELLERQAFRLSWWRTAGDEINWRRFFDITGLAGLRVEDPDVFEAVHATLFRLYREGLIDGMRVDHVDGLADPAAYCRRLRERLAELEPDRPAGCPPGPAYIVVEKILAAEEHLPIDWLVDGTTGYDFMNQVSALQHDPDGEEPLTALWDHISDRHAEFEAEEFDARREMLTSNFAGQLESCARAFHRLARSELLTRDITLSSLRRTLTNLLCVFPAYRTYATAGGAPGSDAPILAAAVDAAKDIAAHGEEGVVDLVAAWLSGVDAADPEARRDAVVRFQQLSAPIAAKAVEDTAFYRYGRLISRNDVGFEPGRLAMPLSMFHEACAERWEHFPGAMLATATHDHKRGEDVRARLAVISEVPHLWAERVSTWFDLNQRFSDDVIDPADEYQFYQTLVGAWPPGLDANDREALKNFAERVSGWQHKALRETKLDSSWVEPDEAYEAACRRFVKTVTDMSASPDFLRDVADFVEKIAPVAALNGLTQAFLRLTVPGVPDTYQGTEFWDFSLVDPDNRRPVDYSAREAALAQENDIGALLREWHDGRVKQALIRRCLAARQAAPDLFANGDYVPLRVRGERSDSVVAFARRQSSSVLVAVAARLTSDGLLGEAVPLPSAEWWGETVVVAPDDLIDTDLEDAFAPGSPEPLRRETRVADLLARLPVSLRYVS